MIKSSRNSLLTKLGRRYQDISPVFRFIDYPFRALTNKRESNVPAVFLVAPPRSGSTLTYQLLTHSFENFHLTNIWNLLYSTPILGSILSEKFCYNKVTEFKSVNGFVPGLCGEAEGMKFWSYWTGQGLNQDDPGMKEIRASRLAKLLGKLFKSYQKPFFSGYLAHAFCMDFLRKFFPSSIFVHVTRDLLSNAFSVYNISPVQWFSLKPQGVGDQLENRYQEIARQILLIHSRIYDQYEKDVIAVRYEELVSNPNNILEKIADHAGKNHIDLEWKSTPPKEFNTRKVTPDLNIHTKELHRYLKLELNRFNGEKRKFLGQLLEQE